jgi:PBP1b-binding outer membrane lipoprotein LpoB
MISRQGARTAGRTRASRPLAVGLFAGLAASLFLAACSSPPQGYRSGRIPVEDSTEAETNDRAVQPSDLASSSDVVAQSLAADIDRLVDQDFGGYRISLKFGDIENKTRHVATTDFEYVRDRIRSKLMSSRVIRDNVKFLEGRQRVEDLNARENGGGGDILNEGSGSGNAPAATNPQYTFYLNGNMYEVSRGSGQSATDLYYMKYQLTRASDGEIVFEKDYEVKYGIARR